MSPFIILISFSLIYLFFFHFLLFIKPVLVGRVSMYISQLINYNICFYFYFIEPFHLKKIINIFIVFFNSYIIAGDSTVVLSNWHSFLSFNIFILIQFIFLIPFPFPLFLRIFVNYFIGAFNFIFFFSIILLKCKIILFKSFLFVDLFITPTEYLHIVNIYSFHNTFGIYFLHFFILFISDKIPQLLIYFLCYLFFVIIQFFYIAFFSVILSFISPYLVSLWKLNWLAINKLTINTLIITKLNKLLLHSIFCSFRYNRYLIIFSYSSTYLFFFYFLFFIYFFYFYFDNLFFSEDILDYFANFMVMF